MNEKDKRTNSHDSYNYKSNHEGSNLYEIRSELLVSLVKAIPGILGMAFLKCSSTSLFWFALIFSFPTFSTNVVTLAVVCTSSCVPGVHTICTINLLNCAKNTKMKSVFCCKPNRIKVTRLERQLQHSRQNKPKWYGCTYWNNKNPHEWRFGRIWADVRLRLFSWKALQMPAITWHYFKEQCRRRMDRTIT